MIEEENPDSFPRYSNAGKNGFELLESISVRLE
jgi:hypothetical protein